MRNVWKLVGCSLFAFMSSASYAVTADTRLCSYDSGNSGETTELGLIEDCIGEDAELISSQVGSFAVMTDTKGTASVSDDVFYLDVSILDPDFPGFFMLKFGCPQGGPNPCVEDTHVFENINELQFLAWDFAFKDFYNVTGLSHYRTIGSAGVPECEPGDPVCDPQLVPEPSGLALFGIALIGLVAMRRRISV